MGQPGKIEELTDNLKSYASTNFELFKLEATERASVIGSESVSFVAISAVAALFVVFISIGAGFYISARMGDTYSGFLIVAGFYLFLTLVLLIGKKKLIEHPLRDKIIRKVFSKN
ncbi:MAG TPA: phage holin family protein [Bacteroidia bacterium]|jgi:hypothetical protein|nr:phage holin family protein [Bacteroidia bacterium]